MSLDLIIGPMFSGKTTELVRRLNTFAAIGKKCVYINSSLDNREEKDFSTHNPDLKSLTKIDSMKVQFINYQFIKSYTYKKHYDWSYNYTPGRMNSIKIHEVCNIATKNN